MLDNKLISEYNETRESENKGVICHAPFASMNFDQEGKIRACCYNRTHSLGTYPADSLRESWFGGRANELRERVGKNDLSLGCKVCYDQLKSRNFYGTRARHFDCFAENHELERGKRSFPFLSRKKIKVSMPRVMEFELSNTCNLECIMCDGHFSSRIRKNREKLPPLANPYNERFVEQLEEFIPHLTDAKFLGGEPFLIDVYYKIWERIRALNPEITVHITTNGAVLTEKVKETLEGLRGGIVVSIDSLRRENFERIRTPASFEGVMNNFHYFLDYTRRKNTWLSLAVCPMTLNWHEIPALIEFCNRHEISICFNTVFKPAEYTLRFLPKFILQNIIAYYRKVELPSGTRREKENLGCFHDLISQLECWLSDKVNQERLPKYLEESIGKLLRGGVSKGIRKDGTRETVTERMMRFFLRYFEYYERVSKESEISSESKEFLSYLDNLIKAREVLVVEFTGIKNETGYVDFFRSYSEALCRLNDLMNEGKERNRFRDTVTEIRDTIMEHGKRDFIIDEICWVDPSFLLKIFTEMPPEEIKKMLEGI